MEQSFQIHWYVHSQLITDFEVEFMLLVSVDVHHATCTSLPAGRIIIEKKKQCSSDTRTIHTGE